MWWRTYLPRRILTTLRIVCFGMRRAVNSFAIRYLALGFEGEKEKKKKLGSAEERLVLS